MAKFFRRPLSIALGALATTSLGGCYYGDVNGYGPSYASNDCSARYGDSYYDYDPYAYDDGYGYDCYDGGDYGSGFVNIGFGGGWYDNYYYPGSGLWLFDSYNNRYPLRGQYLNYWGGRRAWWKYYGGGRRHGGWDGRPRGDNPRRDNDWSLNRDRDRDGPRGTRGNGNWNLDGNRDNPRGTRPPRPGSGAGNPPATNTNPAVPGRGDGRPGGRPGGWGNSGRGDGDGVRGTRPPRPGAGSGTNPVPPTGTAPVRPGRPDGNAGSTRPRPAQGWQGDPGRGGSTGTAPRPRPGSGFGNGDNRGNSSAAPRPAPVQAAPPVRAAPPVVRSAPQPESRPAPRPRMDRQNHVREQ